RRGSPSGRRGGAHLCGRRSERHAGRIVLRRGRRRRAPSFVAGDGAAARWRDDCTATSRPARSHAGAAVMGRLTMGGRMLTTCVRVAALALVLAVGGTASGAERAAKTFHLVLEVAMPAGTPVPTADSTIEFTVGPRVDDPDLWHPFRNIRSWQPV